MARPLRVEFAGTLYHVMSRGDERKAIVLFLTPTARSGWTGCGGLRETYGWRLHAFVLMGTHDPPFVETPEANLLLGMQYLNGSSTSHFNRRHRELGPLVPGLFAGHPASLSIPTARRIQLSTVPLPATVRYNHSRDSCRVGALVWLPR